MPRQYQRQERHYSRPRSVDGSALHLHIPRGGAVAAVGEGIVSKLSQWTSAPDSAFNLALGVLAASTAVLKLYGAAGRNAKGSGEKSVRDCYVRL
jgi:hypothetical protein